MLLCYAACWADDLARPRWGLAVHRRRSQLCEGARGVVETPYTCVTTGKERGCGHWPSARVAVSNPSERSATGLSCLNASFVTKGPPPIEHPPSPWRGVLEGAGWRSTLPWQDRRVNGARASAVDTPALLGTCGAGKVDDGPSNPALTAGVAATHPILLAGAHDPRDGRRKKRSGARARVGRHILRRPPGGTSGREQACGHSIFCGRSFLSVTTFCWLIRYWPYPNGRCGWLSGWRGGWQSGGRVGWRGGWRAEGESGASREQVDSCRRSRRVRAMAGRVHRRSGL